MSQEKVYRNRNVHILFGVTLMAVLAVSSIAPAFTTIVKELNISETEVGMLITAFTLPGVILAPFTGILADRFGRKRILVPSLFLFGLAGSACALVNEFNLLIILRVLQGIGGASLGYLNVTILGDLFHGKQRAEAMGLNASVLNTGVAAYPLIGGALAMLAWNYPFLLSLLAIPVGVLVLLWLRSPALRSDESLRRYLGGTWSYLRNIKVTSALVAGVIIFIIQYGTYLTYLSLLLGISFEASPLVIGLVLSSMTLVAALVSSQLGGIVNLVSLPNLVKLGFAIITIALVLFPFMPRLELMLIPTFIFGLGSGVLIPSLQIYIAGVAPTEYRGAFMAMNATMFRLGQTLGPLIFGLAYIWGGFECVFFVGAALSLVTASIGFIGGRVTR